MSNVVLIKTLPGISHYVSWQRHHPNFDATSSGLLGQIGLVPTMGALHAGHLRLIQQARQENAVVIVSLFVNPLQFSPEEDLKHYPRMLDQDLKVCQDAGVDVLFAPEAAAMVTHGSMTQVVPPSDMISGLCGPSRPGHFQGVATIVLKLLNLVQPDRIYFGQKDAQQLAIVRRLVQDLNLVAQVVACPIVREASGLAYSSRNQYLSSSERQQATALSRGLQQAQRLFQQGEMARTSLLHIVAQTLSEVPAIEPDYIDLVHPQTLQPLERVTQVGLLAIAARLGQTRLIDNVLLDARKPILAIDGPAGAGKSTVTRRCAQLLGLLYLDTGAMYRAVTWLVWTSGIEITDEPAIADLVSHCDLKLEPQADAQQPPHVWVNGQDVTDVIRSRDVTSQVSAIAAQPAVRQVLVQQQRQIGANGGVAVEGRDIGSYVFPEARVKIFLTASIQERAHRRLRDLQAQGELHLSLEQLEKEIIERDRYDSQRAIAPLCKAIDAIELLTDGLRIEEVTEKIVALYQAALAN